jgi:hypothetical protein
MAASPWGELPVADGHVHFFSRPFFDAMARQKGVEIPELAPLLAMEIPEPDPRALATRWAAELDRHGLDRAALIASVPGDEDSVAAAVGSHPGRFFGYFMVDPTAPGVEERVQAALEKGLRGLCFFPAMHRYSMHDERVAPLIDIAVRRYAVVFVHCGVLSVGIRKKLGLPSPFDMRFSNPIDLHAIALRHPGTAFVIPHFGAGYFREALMVCDLCPNVFLDTSSGNAWIKYQEHNLTLRQVFEQSLKIAGPKRLVFGTDSSFFPRGWVGAVFEEQSRLLYELGLDVSDARLIFHDNLVRLFSPENA